MAGHGGEIAEHLGSDTFLYITVEGVGRITARAPGEYTLNVGERVWLTPRPESIHRFDADGRAMGGLNEKGIA